jgi:zona occludens toxin (predicted ATPase)
MRRHKEIIILLALLIGMMGYVLWYVIDRRAKLHAAPPAGAQPVTPAAPKK